MKFSRVLMTSSLLAAASVWAAPQQITLGSTNRAAATLPASAPYSTLATWHVDWRVTVPATAATSPAWNGFNQFHWQIGGGFAGYAARIYGTPFGTGPYTGFSFLINSFQDSPNAQFSCPILQFGQDIVIRVQKFPTLMTCETWNVNGSGYQVMKSATFAAVRGISGTLQIGDASHNQGTMAFFRGYAGNLVLGSKPPFGGIGGDLWDYEFNGTLADGSGHNLTLSGTGGISYTAAATYPPACILPPQTTFRAGTPLTALTGANSFPLDGGETLTYLWQQLPSNITSVRTSDLQLSSQTSAAPTFQGLIAGSYMMQLTVTDSTGQSNTCSMKYGAVAMDSNGSVIVPNAVHAAILGPMTSIVNSPWAAEPQQHLAYAQLLQQKLAGTSPLDLWFVDYWNQALGGTVTVTTGSQTVIGSGTAFTTQFCQGPTNPTLVKHASSTGIAVWYPILNPGGANPAFNGTTGRRFGTVLSCTDDTHMTVSFATFGANAWATSAYVGAGSGLSYGYVEQQCSNVTSPVPNCTGGWGYGPAPANYYDDVKALYALWYRTGLDDYLVAARTLADRWWSYPGIDKGLTYETTSSGNPWANIALANRSMALTGLIMRNADSPPYDYGPGIRAIINYLIGNGTPGGTLFLNCPTGPTLTTCGQDVRESGYALGWVAQDALYNSCSTCASPNAAQVTLDLAALSRDMTNRWGQCQANNGICTQSDNIFSFYASWNTGGTNFSASVTTGSNIVTANGGTWNPANFTSCSTPCSFSNPPNAIWITSTGTIAPTSNAQGDGGWYFVVYHSPTQLYLTDITGQISIPYTGSSKASAGWQTLTYLQSQTPAWLGYYWQPYMTGILNQAYFFVSLALASSDPTNAANAASWAQNNANAMATTGLNTTTQSGFVTNGPYYAIGIMCPGGGPGAIYPNSQCDTGLFADRELNSETLNVATIALRLNPNSTVALTLGNTLISAIYAQPGEEGFTGTNVLADMVNPGFLYTTPLQHKWLGAFWGVGANWSWHATRLGGLRPPIPRVVDLSLNFGTATQAVLTVTRPDGTTTQLTCTSSPCPVTIDARQGDHLLAVKYLDAASRLLRSSSAPLPVKTK